jgi:hypothetical protein
MSSVYSPLDEIMPFIAPPSLRRLKWSFISMARQKVFRRLARPDSKQLDDILGACLSEDDQPSMMSIEELVGTFHFPYRCRERNDRYRACRSR